MEQQLFTVQADYEIPLLQLMAKLPDGRGQRGNLLGHFLEQYGPRIPEQHRGLVEDGKTYTWQKKVEFARYDLVKLGLIDSPSRGVWRITEHGRDWLHSNSGATRITGKQDVQPSTKSERTKRKQIATKRTPHAAVAIPSGITLAKLDNIRKFMPSDEFRRDWGELYDYLLAEERAKSITPIDRKVLLESVLTQVQRIQGFLQGHGSEKPTSEELCDWIHFCYSVNLHREASALWQFVQENEVDSWYYSRTKKIAAVCRTRLGL